MINIKFLNIFLLSLSIHKINCLVEIEWIDENENFEYGEYFEGDMVLTDEQIDATFGRRNALIDEDFYWPNATVTYQLSKDHSDVQNRHILEAFNIIENVSCIRFLERTKNESGYVQFEANNDTCHSEVGYQGKEQIINLKKSEIGTGCFRLGTIIHEVLHALGFYHMHTAPNRDDYVKINFKNIQQSAMKNFRKHNSTIGSNYGIPYDYWSLMHFSTSAYSINEDLLKTIVPLQRNIYGLGQRDRLSKMDVHKLNLVYKCVTSSARNSFNFSWIIVFFINCNIIFGA